MREFGNVALAEPRLNHAVLAPVLEVDPAENQYRAQSNYAARAKINRGRSPQLLASLQGFPQLFLQDLAAVISRQRVRSQYQILGRLAVGDISITCSDKALGEFL